MAEIYLANKMTMGQWADSVQFGGRTLTDRYKTGLNRQNPKINGRSWKTPQLPERLVCALEGRSRPRKAFLSGYFVNLPFALAGLSLLLQSTTKMRRPTNTSFGVLTVSFPYLECDMFYHFTYYTGFLAEKK